MRCFVVVLALVACSEERELSGPCDDCENTLHEPGFADPASASFHGNYLAQHDWNFGRCADCHGEDFSGGKSGVSCLTCHTEGPTACSTCHGDERGAHAVHRGAALDCVECHTKPTSWDAPGHIVGDTLPAEVTFGALAALVTPDRAGPPTWDGARCSNVYCHGDVLHAGGGVATKPLWEQPAVGGCANCHASPPPSHSRGDCASCHPASAPHIDGTVQIASGCSGCHGSASSPAPPIDLAGNTVTTALGVGAHQAHLQGLSALRSPIPCTTCHVVPATLMDVGHIDAAPADVNSELGWDRDARTCTTWCHGTARPPWTSTGQVVCGSCHGVPPTTAPHTTAMTIASCASCHSATVNAFGNILVTGGQHMDGDVDAN